MFSLPTRLPLPSPLKTAAARRRLLLSRRPAPALAPSIASALAPALLAPLLALTAVPLMPAPVFAYSYAANGEEPLLQGRAALFAAVAKGDWAGAEAAYKVMKPDLSYLDEFEDSGISQRFETALSAQDAAAVQAAFTRAAADEIVRRMNGARDNLDTYQVAKTLVVTANRFFAAIEPDVDPAIARRIQAELSRAADAIGNPGVFGVGQKKPDPQDFDEAKAGIVAALKPIRGTAGATAAEPAAGQGTDSSGTNAPTSEGPSSEGPTSEGPTSEGTAKE
ncbi:hypothetical protein [Acidimangrovimonas sediminis]|uniref:hypothetical protein n=1 Tax=Acidimangrovimonas sediminis TaxID=2056283 RepID=UPI001304F029|nr:hypothetical protein [Acidimangrovimonas sediminis]